MTQQEMKKTSIYISLILRHKPQTAGITLDEHGWADVAELISGINTHSKHQVDVKILEDIVKTDQKQEYNDLKPFQKNTRCCP